MDFLVRGFSADPTSPERRALRDKAPDVEALVSLLRSDLPLLLPLASSVRSKFVDVGMETFIKNDDEDGRSHNLTNFIGAVCDKDRAKILWPEEKDLGIEYIDS